MKKSLKFTLIFIVSLIVLYETLGLFGVFKVYNNPTTVNEPNLKLGSKMFVTNLNEPKIGDFVCYKYQNEMLGKHIRVHRLIGKSDDILEIKDGILFINGQDFDKNIELKHFYFIDHDKLQELEKKEVITKEVPIFQLKGKMMVPLSDKVAKENELSNQIKIEPKNKADETIKSIFDQNWNMDNFGPLKIPQGKCFVIGDNRHNSEDSRFIGLIDESDIVGTVIK